MKFKLEFKMDSDSFVPYAADEISMILKKVENRIKWGEWDMEEVGEYPINDGNGNKVGTLEITDEEYKKFEVSEIMEEVRNFVTRRTFYGNAGNEK